MKYNILKFFWERLKSDLSRYLYSASLPTNSSAEDVWLVEFPKSGVTWLSFLLANVNNKMNDFNCEVNFFNIHHFIPDIHLSQHLKEHTGFPGFRFIKSHSELNPYYYRVIYIVRDPRSVMVSYYKFLVGLNSYRGNLSEFIRDETFGIKAWNRHLDMWINKSNIGIRINFLKYEDLLDDTEAQLKHLYRIYGYTIPDKIIQSSVLSSNRVQMKLFESERKELDIRFSKNYSGFQFVGDGGAEGFRESLTTSDIDYINENTLHFRKLFGYNN